MVSYSKTIPPRKCKFTPELAKEFPMFTKSKLEGEIEYLTCNGKRINISNKGKYDIMQHLNSAKHKINVGSSANCSKLTEKFEVKTSKESEILNAVEATLVYQFYQLYEWVIDEII